MSSSEQMAKRPHAILLSRLLSLYRDPVEYFRALPFTILGINIDYPDQTALISTRRPRDEHILVAVLAVAKGRIHEIGGDACVVADMVNPEVLVCHFFTMVEEQMYWYSYAYRLAPVAENPSAITRLTETEEAPYQKSLELPPLCTQLLSLYTEGDARNFAEFNEHPYMNMASKYANIPQSARPS